MNYPIENFAKTSGKTVAQADDDVAAMVAAMTWSNLTQPLLDELRNSSWTWRSLCDIAIAKFHTNGRTEGGGWYPPTKSGTAQIKVNPKGGLRCTLQLQSGPSTTGPNEMNGRDLYIDNVQLPETIMMSIKGRRLDQIVDSDQILTLAPGTTAIRSARKMSMGTKLVLDLPYIQPSADDLSAMRQMEKAEANR